MLVRALRADEGELLRRVRLRALADSPDSFASTLDQEAMLAEADWAARAAGDDDQAVFVAGDDRGEPAAMAGAHRSADAPEVVALWGMWVAPQQRGRGLGAGLVEAVACWADGAGARRLELHVMADVPASVGFYERLGFTRDGEPRVFRRDPARRWLAMSRLL